LDRELATEDEREPPAERRAGQVEPSAPLAGLRMSDLMLLPDEWRRILRWLVRQREGSLEGIAAGLEMEQATTLALLERLMSEGYAQRTGTGASARYRVILAKQRAHGATQDTLRGLDETRGG
jgi:IclR helix-turn-helix domain